MRLSQLYIGDSVPDIPWPEAAAHPKFRWVAAIESQKFARHV
jgi:hypothetical protein